MKIRLSLFPILFSVLRLARYVQLLKFKTPYNMVCHIKNFTPPEGRSHQSGREHLVLLKPTSRFGIMLPACSFRYIVCHEFLWCLMPTRGQKWSTIRQPHNQVSMLTKFREFRCKHVSVSEVGDGFQVLFEKIQGSEVGYVLVQRHFEYPDGGKCYHRNR